MRNLETLLVVGVLLCPQARSAEPVTLTSPNLRLVIGGGADVRLYVRDVPLVTESSLYVVSPGWTKVYLNHDKLAPAVSVKDQPEGRTADVVYENADAYARYTYTLAPDDRLTVKTRWGVKNGKPAQVEYHTYLNANLLEGSQYTASTEGGERKGVVPMKPLLGTQDQCRLTPNLMRIAFSTRLGELTMAVDSSAPDAALQDRVTLFDARGATEGWATKQPVFWMGVGVPVKDVPASGGGQTMVYTFRPSEAAGAGGVETPTVSIRSTPTARPSDTGDRPLIPAPKSVRHPRIAAPRLGAGTRIRIPAKPSAQERKAAEELQADLQQWWALSVPITRGASPKPASVEIVLRTAAGALKGADHPEGYTLLVRPNGVLITGRDPRGTYNGAQTLKQLFRRDLKGVYVAPVAIADWPTLPMRAVHWYGGPEALAFTRRMVDRIVAPLKLNTVFQECEWTQWDSQPKLANPKRCTSKEDLRKIIATEKASFLEVIPILSTLGHADWLFNNGQNRDIVADPSRPYAYNPENPHTYEVLYPIMEEVVDLFHPRIFHIGHDEVTLTGTFPPPGSKKTHTQLYIEDTIRLNDWVKQHGMQTMIWGDCMIHSSEIGTSAWADSKEDAVARRKAIPRDILIADWHYRNAEPDFPSVALFQKEGFTVLPTGWSNLDAQRNLIRVAAERKAMGYMQSTWAGYAMSEAIVTGQDFAQFVGYLTAAEHAWNGGVTAPEKLGYSPDVAFMALWDRHPATGKPTPGFAVTISGAAAFAVPAFGAAKPVCLAGRLNPVGAWPSSVLLPLGDRKARELEFTWGLTHVLPANTVAARVKVTWTDGRSEEFTAAYGQNIFAFTDGQASLRAPIVARATDANGRNASLRRTVWSNSRPEVGIRSVEVVSANTESAPVLYGLTGIQG